jgi:hypothetical protein
MVVAQSFRHDVNEINGDGLSYLSVPLNCLMEVEAFLNPVKNTSSFHGIRYHHDDHVNMHVPAGSAMVRQESNEVDSISSDHSINSQLTTKQLQLTSPG